MVYVCTCKCHKYTRNFAENLVITFEDETLNEATKTIRTYC